MRWIALSLCCLMLLGLPACTPGWPSRPLSAEASVKAYLAALFGGDVQRYDQVAASPLTQAQLDGSDEYRGYTVLDGPTITDGPLPAPSATVAYVAVVRARAASGLDYQFDFTVTLDSHTHRVVGSTARKAVLEPHPCCQ